MHEHEGVGGRRILRWSEVQALTGLARWTARRKWRAGEFPPPCRISANIVGWDSCEIERWVEARLQPCASHPDDRQREAREEMRAALRG